VTAPGLPAELLSRIEDAGLNASAPPQQRWLDGWLVRFSPGKAQRARCINAVAAGRLPLADKLATCAALYRLAGLPMLFRLTPFTQPPELDAQLTERGFEAIEDTRVMVCPTLPGKAGGALPAGLRAESVDLEAYAYIVAEQRDTSTEGRQAHAQRLRHSPVPYRAQVLRSTDGQVVAGGQLALEADLAGLYDVFTAPAWRGRGLSYWLCARLLVQAAEAGARIGYLQVDAGNAPARAVYRRLGFVDAYAYHYRRAPPAG
jgi:GNAT superfamily N-acetyltransferase